MKEYIGDRNKKDYLFIPLNKRKTKKPLDESGIRHIVIQAGKKVNFQIGPHHFRHARATHLYENNWELEEIKDLLGHDDIKSTKLYINPAVFNRRRVLSKRKRKIDIEDLLKTVIKGIQDVKET